MKPRPTTLFGLILAGLAILLVKRRRRAAAAVVAAIASALIVWGLVRTDRPASGSRFATFNIENYPKSPRQVEGAFDHLRALDAGAIGLQEITDPAAFDRTARERLGASWRTVFSDHPEQRVGVLYDTRAFTVVGSAMHRQTELYEGAKPALEVQLRASDGRVTRMFVVHLKARGDGGPVRKRQLDALAPVVRDARATGDEVIVVGDFNATGPDDLVAIRGFASASELDVATEDVPCTSYWNRSDGCLGQPLDHMLTSWSADARAEGACRTHGCAMRTECPSFHRDVSDHCPVVVDR